MHTAPNTEDACRTLWPAWEPHHSSSRKQRAVTAAARAGGGGRGDAGPRDQSRPERRTCGAVATNNHGALYTCLQGRPGLVGSPRHTQQVPARWRQGC